MAGRISRQNFESIREDLGEMMLNTYCHEDNFKRLDRVQELAAEKNCSIPQLALSWVLHQDLNVIALQPDQETRQRRRLDLLIGEGLGQQFVDAVLGLGRGNPFSAFPS